MDDIEKAAEAALAQAKGLEALMAKAKMALPAAEKVVGGLATALAADWSKLSERVRSVLEKAAAEKEALLADGEEASRALADVRGAIADARANGAGALEGARVEVSGLVARLTSAMDDVEDLVETAEDTARAAVGRVSALEGALRAAVEEAREFLEIEVAGDLEAMREEVEDETVALIRSLEALGEALDEVSADWADKLAEAMLLVEGAFGDARAHLESVVEYSLAECARMHGDVWRGDLATLVEEAGGILRELTGALAERKDNVEAGEKALAAGLGDTDDNLVTMLGALGRITKKMAALRFLR